VKSQRILITAFEPFGGRDLNPSQELLQALAPREGLERQLLPVRIVDAWPMLEERLLTFDPDLVLSMGEAGGRAEICLEGRAFNEMDLRVPDNAGLQPRGEKILPSAPERLDSDLPLEGLAEQLRSLGHPVRVSMDAGRHLCNLTLYRLLERQMRQGRPAASFIHLPLLPEQVGQDEEAPSLGRDEQRSALEDLLDLLLTSKLSRS